MKILFRLVVLTSRLLKRCPGARPFILSYLCLGQGMEMMTEQADLVHPINREAIRTMSMYVS